MNGTRKITVLQWRSRTVLSTAMAALVFGALAPTANGHAGGSSPALTVDRAALTTPPIGGFRTDVRFANRTQFRRVEWGVATVPFPIGAFYPGDSFGVGGLPSRLSPFGAKWSDGSFRYAQLHVPLNLAAGEEIDITVEQMSVVAHSFQYSNWVQRAINHFSVKVVVVLPGFRLGFVEPVLVSTIATSDVHRTHYLRGRVPQTDLVVDLWYTELSGQDHMPFELRITNSDTTSSRWEQPIVSAHLWVEGAAAHVRGCTRRGARYGMVSPAGPNVVHLLQNTEIYDGQGQEWMGDFLFYHPIGAPDPVRAETLMATIQHPLFGISLNWRSSGAFGPFGHLPAPPPWIKDGGRAAAITRRTQFDRWKLQPGQPWDNLPLGLNLYPGMTGGQPDFGAARLVHIFGSGMPDGIEEARFNASEEAARPVHHREPDGSRVRRANHPQWIAGGGRTHWHPNVSPDRLGKPSPAPRITANGWKGRDGQHWSTLTMASAFLLTGSPSLRYELENDAELYMAEHTLQSVTPNQPTNNMVASRAIGRTLLSMSWNYLCTDNEELRIWACERVRQSIQPAAVGVTTSGPVRPLKLSPPDPRQLPRTNWRPWEESQAVMGLEAASRAMGSTEGHNLARMVAATVVNYGWKFSSTENSTATAIGWHTNGAPLSAVEINDPTWTMWYTAFNEWSIPCVKLAERFGNMYGDPQLATRARGIMQRLNAGRRAPSSGGWDSYAGWEAVQ